MLFHDLFDDGALGAEGAIVDHAELMRGDAVKHRVADLPVVVPRPVGDAVDSAGLGGRCGSRYDEWRGFGCEQTKLQGPDWMTWE